MTRLALLVAASLFVAAVCAWLSVTYARPLLALCVPAGVALAFADELWRQA